MSLVWAMLSLDTLGTAKRRGVPGPDMGPALKRGRAKDSEPHTTWMAASFQEPRRSWFSLWLLCGLRVENFISWVSVCVLFLESLRREEAD